MQSKKENIRKDVEIRKLANDNKKKGLQALKKADEILRVRKANETLKKLMKSNKSKKDHNENML